MPDLDIQSFIIRYVLISSPNDFRKSYGNMKNYQPLYGAHLTLEDENGKTVRIHGSYFAEMQKK